MREDPIDKPRLGLQRRMALSVFLPVLLAALAICAILFLFNQKRTYRETVRQSEEMIQASVLAFSRSLAEGDEIFLDALTHELRSRGELHITDVYVLRPDGTVAAHSRPEEYGRRYPAPRLVSNPARLSEVSHGGAGSFTVTSLLQSKGAPIGALVTVFSTEHLKKKLLYEMLWIAGATIPILALSSLFVLAHGRRLVARISRLKSRALEIGRGNLGERMEVAGSDEISELTTAFNQMLTDISGLRDKDRKSAETIELLNKDLSAQLKAVGELKEQLADENAALREELRTIHNPGGIIGSSPALAKLLEQAARIAPLPVTVLITGESGTGKELLARLLHEAGANANGPFITVNCAALPANLIESELFGHEKGSFTGAVSQKKGKFEIASGGTIFLDEIGELPVEAQAKFLRVLQSGEVVRVGGEKPIPVAVRVVAATNRDIADEVRRKRFREDLYYRLKVVEMKSPPLRERIEDLPALAQHFIEMYGRKLGKNVVGISPSALKLLSSYRWPGNIRELENMTARAVALARSQVLGPGDFSFIEDQGRASGALAHAADGPASKLEALLELCSIPNDGSVEGIFEKVVEGCESICLQEALNRTRNQKEAAEALGLTTTKIHRLLKKYGLSKDA